MEVLLFIVCQQEKVDTQDARVRDRADSGMQKGQEGDKFWGSSLPPHRPRKEDEQEKGVIVVVTCRWQVREEIVIIRRRYCLQVVFGLCPSPPT
jgi:hypothetical protein